MFRLCPDLFPRACSFLFAQWPDFEFPVFYTMWHMIFSSVAALILLTYVNPAPTGLPTVRQFWEYKGALIPIAACTTLNAGLNNMSLTMVSLFVNQVIKASSPLPAAAFSYAFAGKTFSREVVGSVLLIVVGSMLANAHSVGAGGSGSSLTGVLLCATSLLANALKPVLQMLAMSRDTAERPKLAPTVVLFYDCGVSFFFMLAFWLLSSERAASLAYLEDPSLTMVGLGIICAGASMAFGFNLAVYYFVAYTSALTTAIGANGIKIFLISASAMAAGVTDFLSWLGIFIVIVAIIVYAYLNYQEGQRSRPASAGIVPPAPGGGGVHEITTEKSALVGGGGSRV